MSSSSKWRISKACHECVARKVKCNGQTPCQRCQTRGIDCVYREKARIRQRTAHRTAVNGSIAASTPASASPIAVSQTKDDGAEDLISDASAAGGDRDFHNYSVAATHQASPSCRIQLYYGPSSNFSLLHSIYHQIEGTNSPSQRGMEEIGPGLDLFSHRRLFFGDLADSSAPPLSKADDYTGILMAPQTARALLERYLQTYWHALPFMSKEQYRRKLDEMFRPPAVFNFDSPDSIITLLGTAMGAYMLGQYAVAEFLYQKSRQGSARLEEVVNIEMVQVYMMMYAILQIERAKPNSSFLHLGCAVRRAVAIGLHKEAGVRAGENPEEIEQKRTIFWSLLFWEIWIGFMIGRPSSISDPGNAVPMPKHQKFLNSMVTLSRIMSRCINQIYSPRHESVLRMWTTANDIRQDLHRFAEQQSRDMGFQLVGHVKPGEEGFCQALLSSTYHQTLLLTFRPFLILRTKLKQSGPSDGNPTTSNSQTPPIWFEKASECCLETAKSAISFLAGAVHSNILCREVKYLNYFVEGACYVLALDLLQQPRGTNADLSWICTGLRCLRKILPASSYSNNNVQTPTTIASIIRMMRYIVPDFEMGSDTESVSADPDLPVQSWPSFEPDLTAPRSTPSEEPKLAYPSMPLTSDGNFNLNDPILAGFTDFTAANMGLDFDFGTMDMDAFLSIDANQNWEFR